ncbi:hypothetical protein CWI38_0229p0030 [Hamiltosporidium tvaerminnensis]|uniref:Protein farnesyltransferase/geranylgeranyltransferase type-1 subunit alpha n=2 Tax=Hamiltosporidium TaxID=1176354 RepID=A0A4Q9L988_9MICR|nr:CAAX geranylgeranyltransferase alpha subunit [Hamiltosporidium tvaerminnensis]TBU01004.1 hypothetical protein CWI39_1512p0010 [Hamiltosporidium magnivora]TBU01706.1 hypothetical protein CWI37_0647p0020 [Hamiltosporidium tvaerminnensis]TBU04299.1 hypothetical protein CWI36_0783p0010 [Hamiltosporidium magnivora]TBU18744.1 hypothetical protein CWI38_0229p0030 [Hamiltosporidium tvaerminnensis]
MDYQRTFNSEDDKYFPFGKNGDVINYKDNFEYKELCKIYYFLKTTNMNSTSLLGITSKLCEINMIYYEFWYVKRKIVTKMFEEYRKIGSENRNNYLTEYERISLWKKKKKIFFLFELTRDLRLDYTDAEMNWIQKCVQIHHKNYQIWNHLDWFSIYRCITPSNLSFVNNVFKEEPKNIHAWTFITKYCRKSKSYTFGLDLTEKMIVLDQENNSAWNCRFYIIKELNSLKYDVLETEISFLKSINFSCNIAAINYLFGLTHFLDIDAFIFNTFKPIYSLYFKKKFFNFIFKERKSDFPDSLKILLQECISMCQEEAKRYQKEFLEAEIEVFSKNTKIPN